MVEQRPDDNLGQHSAQKTLVCKPQAALLGVVIVLAVDNKYGVESGLLLVHLLHDLLNILFGLRGDGLAFFYHGLGADLPRLMPTTKHWSNDCVMVEWDGEFYMNKVRSFSFTCQTYSS